MRESFFFGSGILILGSTLSSTEGPHLVVLGDHIDLLQAEPARPPSEFSLPPRIEFLHPKGRLG